MNKKNNAKKIAALLLGAALAVGTVGCGGFVETDNEKDLTQTVAEVDVSAALAKDEYKDVAADVTEIVKSLSTEISKQDLVAYFMSTGYQYVQNYGYSYKETFEMLMEGLVSRKIMIQYAVAYYLQKTDLTAAGCKQYVEEQLNAVSESEKALLKDHPEVLTFKYFLTEGGKDDTDYNVAVYNLKKSINSSLDSLEESYISAEGEEHNHGDVRTLPNGVDTEKENYYTHEYEIYTGRNTLDACGDYEKIEGSTTSSRQKAYNAFLANLQSYNLISKKGNKIEDTSKVTNLNYYYVELSSILGQSIISKYYKSLEETATAQLEKDNADGYMKLKYDEIFAAQENTYASDPTAFATAMDSVSDNSFLLYGLDGFGYVYNILLPFSSSQSIRYSEAKNNAANTQDDLYNIRKKILSEVKGKDLRDSWFSEHDHANYSYLVKEGEEEKYYFFKDLDGSAQYEKLKQYAGTYAYNGKVEKDEDGEFKFTPNEVSINEFIAIMEGHINKTIGGTEDAGIASGSTLSDYEQDKESKYTDETTGKVNYGKFMYYRGTTNLGTVEAKDYFNEESKIYQAISAVNELMFAYSTDTGCLNTYYGYAVSPYKTDFVKEFEYAAREAIKGGVGTYVVCATDYGWHIIYASYVYNGGDVYGGYNKDDVDKEGTFSNLFYESLKSSAVSNYSSAKQSEVLNRYNNDDSVTLYESRYQDLMEMDS